MTAHTPGPWGKDIFDCRVWSHAGKLVALPMGAPASGGSLTVEEIEANAYLIAAAPEMLEALKAIESCLAPDDNDYAAKKVRAAIKKAEGRT